MKKSAKSPNKYAYKLHMVDIIKIYLISNNQIKRSTFKLPIWSKHSYENNV